MPLQDIPVGIDIHNVELQPGAGGKIARSAGNLSKYFWDRWKLLTN